LGFSGWLKKIGIFFLRVVGTMTGTRPPDPMMAKKLISVVNFNAA